MEKSVAIKVKKYLEELYDIPFEYKVHGDELLIIPENDGNELFTIHAKIKNKLRLIIEVFPEKYAALSIQDMSSSSNDKKMLFAEYAKQLKQMKAKVDFSINKIPVGIDDPASWPSEWKNYRLRASRSPVCSDDEEYNEYSIFVKWIPVVTGMFLALLTITEKTTEVYKEGGVSRYETNRYERNPVNRELCLVANGYTCKICGFNFEKKYGEIGHNFIHVHHIVPVSQKEEAYYINPVNDLIPVCPNCHAMLHRKDPPLMPSDLKKILHDVSIIDSAEKEYAE